MPVTGEWISSDTNPILVKLPTHESITGDKLTAFAPNTTGIPYNQGKELEIVKQLFDLGRLFHAAQNIETVKASFDKTVQKEIIYRGNRCSREDVLEDIIQTGLLIAKRERNKAAPHLSNYKEIQRGLLQFKPYQMGAFFRIEEAIVSSAKAALMAASIKSGSNEPIVAFPAAFDRRDYPIQNPEYAFLNKLQPEALFYWHKTLQTLNW